MVPVTTNQIGFAPTDRTDYRMTWGFCQDDPQRVASNEPPFFGMNIGIIYDFNLNIFIWLVVYLPL